MTANERLRKWRKLHKDEINQRRRENRKNRTAEQIEIEKNKKNIQYSNNKQYYANKHKKWSMSLKTEVMNAYGNVCVICGESHIECLTIDHSNNDGAEFRINAGYVRRGNKEDKGNKKQDSFTGVKFYAWLKKNDFPKNLGLRVLCWNCNCSIGAYGYSPYEKD